MFYKAELDFWNKLICSTPPVTFICWIYNIEQALFFSDYCFLKESEILTTLAPLNNRITAFHSLLPWFFPDEQQTLCSQYLGFANITCSGGSIFSSFEVDFKLLWIISLAKFKTLSSSDLFYFLCSKNWLFQMQNNNLKFSNHIKETHIFWLRISDLTLFFL